jgi:hypothetical protein
MRARAILSLSFTVVWPCTSCHGYEERTTWEPVPQPWLEAEPIALEPFRTVIIRNVAELDQARRMRVLPAVPLTFVEAAEPNALFVLDQRYANLADSRCVPTTLWPDLDDGSRRGSCNRDAVEVQRGLFQPPSGVRAVAADEKNRRAYAVDGEGTFYVANVDVLSGNPLDFLHFAAVASKLLPTAATEATLVVDPSGDLFYGDGDDLLRVSPDGVILDQQVLSDGIVDGVSDASRTWLLTRGGVRVGEAFLALSGVPIRGSSDGAGGLWITIPSEGRLAHLVVDGSEIVVDVDEQVDGITGPLAVDTATGRIAVGMSTGVGLRDPDGAMALVGPERIVDIAMGPGHEFVLLAEDGVVSVHVDQEALAAGAPLSVWMAAMAETPRNDPSEVDCAEGEDALVDLLHSSVGDMRMFATTPMPVALGITPALARKVKECDATALYQTLWSYGEVEPGVLFHDSPSACSGEMPCYTSFLSNEIRVVEEMGIDVHWVGGLDSHWDDGYDWVQGLLEEGTADRLMFHGLGVLPEVTQADPRNKEPFPYEGATPTTRFFVDTAADISPKADGLRLLSGNTVSAYTLGGCADLFITECKLVDDGGNAEYASDDVAVLNLLLQRALAVRSVEGPDTWYFHMPDIGVTDYTAGCVMDESGLWTAESEDTVCQAALVQSWILDVHQRFALQGIVAWALPSDVP